MVVRCDLCVRVVPDADPYRVCACFGSPVKGELARERLRGCSMLFQSFLLCNNPSVGFADTSLYTREAKVDCARMRATDGRPYGEYTSFAFL